MFLQSQKGDKQESIETASADDQSQVNFKTNCMFISATEHCPVILKKPPNYFNFQRKIVLLFHRQETIANMYFDNVSVVRTTKRVTVVDMECK